MFCFVIKEYSYFPMQYVALDTTGFYSEGGNEHACMRRLLGKSHGGINVLLVVILWWGMCSPSGPQQLAECCVGDMCTLSGKWGKKRQSLHCVVKAIKRINIKHLMHIAVIYQILVVIIMIIIQCRGIEFISPEFQFLGNTFAVQETMVVSNTLVTLRGFVS